VARALRDRAAALQPPPPRNAIDDYFFDVLRDEKGFDLPVEVLDDLELKIMDLARARFAA
jgi:type I restriction enzyme, R subunit